MKTYFAGELCARRPLTVAAGLVMTTVGAGLAVIWIPKISGFSHPRQVMGAILALLFVLVWFAGGIFLLLRAFQNRKTRLLITSEGLSCGGLRRRWDEVAEIGVIQKYWRRKDLYYCPQLRPFTIRIELLVSTGLTPQQIRSLFEELRNEVAPLHAHLRLVSP